MVLRGQQLRILLCSLLSTLLSLAVVAVVRKAQPMPITAVAVVLADI
jgi:hypothetical protein